VNSSSGEHFGETKNAGRKNALFGDIMLKPLPVFNFVAILLPALMLMLVHLSPSILSVLQRDRVALVAGQGGVFFRHCWPIPTAGFIGSLSRSASSALVLRQSTSLVAGAGSCSSSLELWLENLPAMPSNPTVEAATSALHLEALIGIILALVLCWLVGMMLTQLIKLDVPPQTLFLFLLGIDLVGALILTLLHNNHGPSLLAGIAVGMLLAWLNPQFGRAR
jgi:hypothetical protein